MARVITFAPSKKARNVAASPGARAAVCQVDGGRYLTLEGPATVTDDPECVALAVAAYAERYRQPKERDDRVVIEIQVDRILGRRWSRAGSPRSEAGAARWAAPAAGRCRGRST